MVLGNLFFTKIGIRELFDKLEIFKKWFLGILLQ
jgi:hypothetical protein